MKDSILLIEDDFTKKILFKALLQSHAESIDIVESPLEVLPCLKSKTYNYIFLNHYYSNTENSNIINKIKKKYPYVKFISISNDNDVIDHYKMLGYDDFLNPPFLQNVKRILNK